MTDTADHHTTGSTAPTGHVLTWDQIVETCSRIHTTDSERMLDITIRPFTSASRNIDATIVPTRMHEPGFYVRSRTGTPTWASWQLRSDDDLALFRRHVDAGKVTTDQHHTTDRDDISTHTTGELPDDLDPSSPPPHTWDCGDPYSGIGCPEPQCTHDPANYPHDARMTRPAQPPRRPHGPTTFPPD